jgi:hypothetical protein
MMRGTKSTKDTNSRFKGSNYEVEKHGERGLQVVENKLPHWQV